MTPYYADETVTLYQGDALAVLAGLPGASVDAVFADPPYSSGGMFRDDRKQDLHTKYVSSQQLARGTGSAALPDIAGDTRDQRGYWYWCALWLSECLRIVKPQGVAGVFADWRQLPITTDALQAGGWVWRGIVPWWKPNGRPIQGRYSNSCEYIAWGTNGPRALDVLGGKALPGFYQATAPTDRDHVTQKPLEVMRGLVRITLEGGTILDPFMGSGTTGVAAIIEGRKFIGVEMVEAHLETAVRRIEAAKLRHHGGEQEPLPLEVA